MLVWHELGRSRWQQPEELTDMLTMAHPSHVWTLMTGAFVPQDATLSCDTHHNACIVQPSKHYCFFSSFHAMQKKIPTQDNLKFVNNLARHPKPSLTTVFQLSSQYWKFIVYFIYANIKILNPDSYNMVLLKQSSEISLINKTLFPKSVK